MAALETPGCDFESAAPDFNLKGTDGNTWTLQDCAGPRGTLIMFTCNHCPYVKAILDRIVRDTNELLEYGIHSVAIMSNDPSDYPEDSFDNMIRFAERYSFSFPYLLDTTQETAKSYGAVCTPDFFGFNTALKLQYRGRLDDSGIRPDSDTTKRELFEAMKQISQTGIGPVEQTASVGCSIKWTK